MPVLRLINWWKNKSTEDKALANTIFNITGSYPSNIALYKLAFTHSSAGITSARGSRLDNERLEFLGDAVLDLVVADLLFKRFPYRDEGFLTEMRSKIVNAASLDQIARKINIQHLLITENHRNVGFNRNKNVFADALEALIGAIYLDKGFTKAVLFIKKRLIERYIDIDDLIKVESNYKSKILEWAHKTGNTIAYEVINSNNGQQNKLFEVELRINNKPVAIGKDYNKKSAEQEAAKKYFEQLSSHNDHPI